MPKRKRKKYSRPRKPFDKTRINEENVLRERYGLKNKKEIWKADASIGRIRNLAKQFITASDEEKKAFVERLQKKGFGIRSIADVLALDKEDWLKRRLQTVLFSKKFANTPKQARQLIAHKHVSVGDQIVNIPSYHVKLEEENSIKLNLVLKIIKKEKSKVEKISEEVLDAEKEIAQEIAEEVDEKVKKEEKAEEKIIKEEIKKVEKGEGAEKAEKEIAQEIAEEVDEKVKKEEKAEEKIIKEEIKKVEEKK